MYTNVFFFQAEDGIRDVAVTGVQTCALPISLAQAAVALPSAPARYNVAPRLYQCAGSPGSRAARAANESAATRSAPASNNASALGVWDCAGGACCAPTLTALNARIATMVVVAFGRRIPPALSAPRTRSTCSISAPSSAASPRPRGP